MFGRESPEDANTRRCREFLKPLEDAILEHAPDDLSCRYGRGHPAQIDGLIVERKDGSGHSFVVPVASMTINLSSLTQGGICPEPGQGINHTYCITIHPGKAWREGEPEPQVSWDSIDAKRVASVEEATDLVLAWAFPETKPAQHVGSAERERLVTIAQGRRKRFSEEQQRQSTLLRHEGKTRESWQAMGVEARFEFAAPPLVHANATGPLAEDLRALRPDWLMWNFPSEDDGRWPLDEHVILATYESAEPLSKDRVVCLTASSPARRKEAQVLSIALESLIPENHAHRWDLVRGAWDGRRTEGLRTGWGVEGIPMTLLAQGTQGDAKALADLEKRCAKGGGTPGERAALSVLLLDAGRLLEALAMFGIECDDRAQKLLAGETLYAFSQPESWAIAAQTLIRRMAPWLLEQSYLTLCSLKPKKKKQRFRIMALPNQTQQAKLSVFLCGPAEKTGKVRLELESKMSNQFVPLAYHQRPLEFELLRYDVADGLFPGEDLP